MIKAYYQWRQSADVPSSADPECSSESDSIKISVVDLYTLAPSASIPVGPDQRNAEALVAAALVSSAGAARATVARAAIITAKNCILR